FFFQAEDGIRDRNVTGVQTCALPILKFLPSIWEQIQRQFIVLNSQNNEAFIEAELIISKNECLNLAYEYPQEIILLKPDHYVEDFKNQIKSLFKHYHI